MNTEVNLGEIVFKGKSFLIDTYSSYLGLLLDTIIRYVLYYIFLNEYLSSTWYLII
ncbi:hypothetical protein GGR27_003787 [Lewinella antarctica]|uniref:Photosystem II protein I n=1 Tax=Neolewinella antarctica TaxID=442734 RepID=A0ABX0XHA0_9BACT|nr:hypothetical protein [Neolewinella antarctica]